MVIGLTGGIGTGKSTVSQILKDRGFPVIDLDVISHEVIEFSSVVEKIVQNFGREVLDEDEAGNCTISREKLGKIIFSDKKKRLALNSIMHPEILKVMHKKILECELGKNKKKNKIRFFIDLKGLRFLKLKLSIFCCIIIVKYGLNKRFLWSILN